MTYYLVAVPIALAIVSWLHRARPFTVADLDPVVVDPATLVRWDAWTQQEAACLGPSHAVVRHVPVTAAERGRERDRERAVAKKQEQPQVIEGPWERRA